MKCRTPGTGQDESPPGHPEVPVDGFCAEKGRVLPRNLPPSPTGCLAKSLSALSILRKLP